MLKLFVVFFTLILTHFQRRKCKPDWTHSKTLTGMVSGVPVEEVHVLGECLSLLFSQSMWLEWGEGQGPNVDCRGLGCVLLFCPWCLACSPLQLAGWVYLPGR